MKKKLILNILIFSIFTSIYSCFSRPETHYIQSVENEQSNGKYKLIVQLYDNEEYDSLLIKINRKEVLFQKYAINNNIKTVTVDNSKVLEFLLKNDTKYLIVKYKEKKYKFNINKKFNIMFLDIRLNKIELAYTNRDPIFTDY
ncbi:hypothetical protein KRE40_11145 [Elizabethkingia meningoseptica]|uniref:hypothetical protein n=1 Tax=Elizabethkingia meningoseptica TaxID=238 RepID=UPI0022F1A9D0|nr:hypothetical protein [Elizabethkingia meningoseptica]EJK5329985.1 hypothetical protein [Elizabethkingia meningoseptica]MDE5439238.1 hypothetical protein [Elizabethkingia meningoseptica]MDE5468569.1 hypothetical protein [Elizabethkingia meningoseptica]MDE5475881.1 hypothetical protein [Elizabethkingia meningoseptica]MDE5478816.1 hypothetical protein [Elizabethkingia meningoseptica]